MVKRGFTVAGLWTELQSFHRHTLSSKVELESPSIASHRTGPLFLKNQVTLCMTGHSLIYIKKVMICRYKLRIWSVFQSCNMCKITFRISYSEEKNY